MKNGPLNARELLAWSYIVPVGSIWALVSFFPAIGLFEEDAAILSTLGQLLFLATGFYGLVGLTLGLRLLTSPERREALPNPLKGKPMLISAYITVWLAAYAAFQFAV